MPAAQARIETGRAGRYLTQLCQHVQSIYSTRRPLGHTRRLRRAGHNRGRLAQPPRVEWTDTRGTVSFGDAVITLTAGPSALTLRAEASSEEDLQRAQELVTGLLARFGRRDHLSVTWQQAGAAA